MEDLMWENTKKSGLDSPNVQKNASSRNPATEINRYRRDNYDLRHSNQGSIKRNLSMINDTTDVSSVSYKKTRLAFSHDNSQHTRKSPISTPVNYTAKSIQQRLEHGGYNVEDKAQKAGIGLPDHIIQQNNIGTWLDYIWALTQSLAEEHFSFQVPLKRRDQLLTSLAHDASPELVKIAGYITVGGPNGNDGWVELLVDPKLRGWFVAGILGKVIVEHIFSAMLFGCAKEVEIELHRMQFTTRNADAFYRTSLRETFTKNHINGFGVPLKFESVAARITIRIFALLEPILQLDNDYVNSRNITSTLNGQQLGTTPTSQIYTTLIRDIWLIVTTAGWLSIQMRLDGSTIYYFSPLPKDSAWEDEVTTECLNPKEMNEIMATQRKHRSQPHTNTISVQGSGQPLVRIVSFLGCTAYRKGGFRVEDHKGFCSRPISKARVVLRCGNPVRVNEISCLGEVRYGNGNAVSEDFKELKELLDEKNGFISGFFKRLYSLWRR